MHIISCLETDPYFIYAKVSFFSLVLRPNYVLLAQGELKVYTQGIGMEWLMAFVRMLFGFHLAPIWLEFMESRIRNYILYAEVGSS